MKDCFGKELNIGDTVVFIRHNWSNKTKLSKGKVNKVLNSYVEIGTIDGDYRRVTSAKVAKLDIN